MTHATLIVPSYQGAARLPVLLEALTHQTYDDWDAIVVIDGDDDEMAGSATVAQYADRLPLRCIVLPENKGRVAALNAGFAAATGDVLIRCDDDFEPSPGHIAAHVAAHATGPSGAVGLPLNIAPDSAYMRAYGAHADRNGRQTSYALPADQRWRIWGGNTSVSRSVFDTVGPFDSRYSGYGWEDLDFGYRVHQAGFPIQIVRDAEVRHYMAAVNTVIRADRAFRSGQARSTFETIHGTDTTEANTGQMGWWDRAVAKTSSHLTRDRTRVLAGAVDHSLPYVPAPVGRKLVALTVESAAQAGFAQGETDVA